MPTYLGNSVETITEGGKLFSQVGDSMKEVVYATATDLAKLPYSDLAEGFYLVGSGNTGVAGALATMSAIYGTLVVSSAFLMKRPYPGYVPQGWTPPVSASGAVQNVNAETVLKTPQFWLLFTTSTLLCTGGMGLMSVAKPMIGKKNTRGAISCCLPLIHFLRRRLHQLDAFSSDRLLCVFLLAGNDS